MTDQSLGIPYFALSTGIVQDPKVFDLMYRYGTAGGAAYDKDAAYAALGRFIDLLTCVYDEGFALEVTRQRLLQLSDRLGLPLADASRFLDACVESGLFDQRLYDAESVLTSRGIQERYRTAARKRRTLLPPRFAEWVLIEGWDPCGTAPPDGDVPPDGQSDGGGLPPCDGEDAAAGAPSGRSADGSAAEVGQSQDGATPTLNLGTDGAAPPKTAQSKSKRKRKTLDKKGDDPRIGRIIAHLNSRAMKSFRPDSKANRSVIAARLAEGYTEDDCIAVIDTMCAQWLGNPDMAKYLRPETLFRASKFEGYLNSAPAVPANPYSGAF